MDKSGENPEIWRRIFLFLYDSKNKPPALQGEGISLDKRINSCVMIEVGLQNHK